MRCPRCQHECPTGQKFCGECGERLPSVCPACRAAALPGQKFCGECGARLGEPHADGRFASLREYLPGHLAERILTSRAALEGERKQVTVLFADLKGAMDVLAERDPEEVRKLLDPVLEQMMAAVHRYEGTVNQVMGDGIMALFGAPLAHEDHAVRACFAALRMQESVKAYADVVRRSHGAVVKIRVGLNSGEVVVRSIGSDLHMDYTAVGQTTHLAARMEQLADPGAIVITPETLSLTEGHVEVRSLGPVPVKGLTDTMEVFEVTGAGPARTRLQAAARRGLTRFVGRSAELDALRRAQQLVADEHGQVVALAGEAGVGKSRLVYELTHSHQLQGWLVLETAAVSYGKATSYLPVIDVLKSYFKIQDRDDLRAIREKVTGKVLTLDEELKPTLPAVLALLDVPVDDTGWWRLDAGRRRQLTLDGITRLLLREAREQPLLLIVEDLHWADSETQALLDGLVESLGSTRLLLLVNYRPEYHHTWSGTPVYRQIQLDALPAQSAGELLDALLGPEPGLEQLKALLVRRGNPFFLEESVRTLVETGALGGERGRYRLIQPVQAIKVPPTVQAMLAARVDRLAPEDKRLLRTASVVGKDVPYALLEAIADLPEEALRGGLDRLQAAEFLYESGLFPELEYAFTHGLTHEVTYGGLLLNRRRELHARLVSAIESLHQDRLGEQLERLAHHSLRGEVWDKAVPYLRQAGGKAAARSALSEARGWLEQALEVLAALPESPSTLEQGFEIRLELRPVLGQLSEYRRVLERLREAEALAETLNDDGRRGRVCAVMTNAHSQLGELDEALVTGRRALEIGGRLGDWKLRLLTTTYLEQAHYFRGDYGRAVELAMENLAALPADSSHETFGAAMPIAIYDRYLLVRCLAQLGRFATSARYEAEALQLAESTRHAYPVGMAHLAASWRHLLGGGWARARAMIEHGIAAYRTGNIVLNLPHAIAASAWALAQVGESVEAASRLREGEQLLDRAGAGGIIGLHSEAYHSLGRAALLLGRLDESQALADRALAYSPSHPGFAAHATHLLGDLAAHPERLDAAQGEAHYRRALALAEGHAMRPLAAHCHLGLGTLARLTGVQSSAREHLGKAAAEYREMDMGFWLERATAEGRRVE